MDMDTFNYKQMMINQSIFLTCNLIGGINKVIKARNNLNWFYDISHLEIC